MAFYLQTFVVFGIYLRSNDFDRIPDIKSLLFVFQTRLILELFNYITHGIIINIMTPCQLLQSDVVVQVVIQNIKPLFLRVVRVLQPVVVAAARSLGTTHLLSLISITIRALEQVIMQS